MGNETRIRGNVGHDDLIAQLEKVCAAAGIDGLSEGGPVVVSEEKKELAKKIIRLLPAQFLKCGILVHPNGDVVFEWRKTDTEVFSLAVVDNNKVYYAVRFFSDYANGGLRFNEQYFQTNLYELLTKFYSKTN